MSRAQGTRDARLRLPFDQYQRYRIVADAVEVLRGDGGSLRILDVGGGEGAILRFLSADEVTVLDLPDAGVVPGMVEGDATALQFEDGACRYRLPASRRTSWTSPGRKGSWAGAPRRTSPKA